MISRSIIVHLINILYIRSRVQMMPDPPLDALARRFSDGPVSIEYSA